jgi:hypothetical protein
MLFTSGATMPLLRDSQVSLALSNAKTPAPKVPASGVVPRPPIERMSQFQSPAFTWVHCPSIHS